jgi:hypothetical protein
VPKITDSAVRALALVIAALLLPRCLWAQTRETLPPSSRKQLSMTIYNSGFALVRDAREVQLPAGIVRLQCTGFPTRIEPDSVQIASVSAPERLSVLEQDYEYHPLSPSELLKQYVGREVTIVGVKLENNSQVEQPVVATLVSDAQSPVWEIGGRLVTGLNSHHYIFSNPPPNLVAEPTLTYLLDNHDEAIQTVQLAYLTTGIHWTATYSLTLRPVAGKADLLGWASISNESGADFPHATLQLVAGAVHRVEARPRPVFAMATALAKVPPQFSQRSFSAYHLYTLARPTSLLNHESKQISLVRILSIPFTKDYEVNGRAYYYRMPQPPTTTWNDPVELHVLFRNGSAALPGKPLPAGIVRVYQTDAAGRIQLLGEDNISHTPQGEEVNLNVGSAFDEVERRKQLSYQRLGPEVSESVYEITLRNHRAQSVTIGVNEPFNGDWRILSSTLPYKKTSAFSARFRVTVPGHGQTEFQYRVQVNWAGARQ